MKSNLAFLLCSLILFASATAKAIDAADEAKYADDMEHKVRPFFGLLPNGGINSEGATIQPGTMTSKVDHKTKIAYLFVRNPDAKATIVVVNGMSENYMVYREIIYDLYHAGYSVFSYDHRGQGLSDRLDGMDKPTFAHQTTHVDNFYDYVLDLDQIVTEVVESPKIAGNQPKVLIGHSMGGGISAIYLADPDHAKHFRAAALTSPMLEIITNVFTTIPVVRELDLTKLVPSLDNLASHGGLTLRNISGHEKEPAQISYWCANLNPDIKQATDPLTSSPARYAEKIKLYTERQDLCINGPSNQWVDEVLKTMFIFRAIPFLSINIPMVLFQAGADSLVLPEYQGKFCDRDPNCKLIPIPDAHHEILMENDDIRNKNALATIYKLFKSALPQ